MKYTYQMNQPGFAMMAKQYRAFHYGAEGILNFYMFKVCNFSSHNDVMLFPDGEIDIMFVKRAKMEYKIFMYGTPMQTSFLDNKLDIREGDCIFGVRMFPDVIPHIVGISSEESVNAVINLSNLFELQKIALNIFSEMTFENRIKQFLEAYHLIYFKKYEMKHSDNRLAEYIMERIVETNGAAKMNDISEEACYSTRYVDKIFHDEFGISPKYFSRIVRFHAVVMELMSDKKIIDISEDVKLNEGNLIREFKTISGYTPRNYRKTLMEYQDRLKVYNFKNKNLFELY